MEEILHHCAVTALLCISHTEPHCTACQILHSSFDSLELDDGSDLVESVAQAAVSPG